MALALVTVPPEGGIYYGQVYLDCLQRTTGYGSHCPSTLYLERGQDNGDEPVLGPNELFYAGREVVLFIGVSPPEAMAGQQYHTQCSCIPVRESVPSVVSIGCPCKVVILPAAISRLLLKRLRIETTAAS